MRIIGVFAVFFLGACSTKTDQKPIAKIGNESIYMETVDSLLGDQLNTMRKNALQSLISIKLMKLEAEKKGLNHQQYKDQEIFQKSREVFWEEVSSYALRNGIEPQDSNQWNLLREQRKLAYRKSRHAVLIDSLRKFYHVEEFYDKPDDPSTALIDQLEGQERGAPQPLAELHVIFDYDCGHCMIEKDVLDLAFAQWGGVVKFNYIYYAPEYSIRGRIADAVGQSSNFWQAWPMISNSEVSTDELQNVAIEKGWITSPMDNMKARFQKNKERLKELGIYSVPTYILNGIVLPPNTTTDELLSYLYSQLSYQVEQEEVS